jgi:dienelactone hydrolase
LRWEAYRIPRAWLGAWLLEGGAAPAETFVRAGDAGLVARAGALRPERERPELGEPDALRAWQGGLRSDLLELFDLEDVATPRRVVFRTHDTQTLAGELRRSFLSLEAHDGAEIPAYLFEPIGRAAPRPAVIVLHGHVGPYEEGITQTGGLVSSYHGGAALELARAGYVTLAIELRGFGYLGAQANLAHVLVAYNALLSGTFYKAVLAQDVKQAFDFLRTRPEVDPERIGITGVSFGGEMALAYAALDERVRAVAIHGHGGPTGPAPGVEGSSAKPQPHYCHIVPGHNRYLLREDWHLLVAPRPAAVLRGDQERVALDALEHQLRPAYTAIGDAGDLLLRVEPGGHEFFSQPTIAFFDRHL